MTGLYVATRILTFFGTYLRTFWEHVSCRIARIPAEDVRAFKSSEMCGHVEHALVENLKQSFIICWLPFTMNFIVGCALLMTGSYRLFYIGQLDAFQPYILTILGFSCIANCAPSFEDALMLKECIYGGDNKVLKIVLAPFFAVAYSMAYIERYSLTVILAGVFTVAFPYVFTIFFPIFERITEMMR